MKKITRYILFELIVVFLITLSGVTLLMIFAGLIKEGLREGLGFASVMRMLPYVIPVALQPSLPATILIAVSSVYGRMSADNEIVAIKSMGISPGLILGFLVSIFGVWINDIAPSWGKRINSSGQPSSARIPTLLASNKQMPKRTELSRSPQPCRQD